MPERAPSSRYAWGVVTLLAAAYVLSFIDRQVLGLLITPIKQSMQLSDTELGLLMGPAFAIFYVTLGWPIGWLADRANRRNIIAAGIALWSLMTMGCGLSRTFTQLFDPHQFVIDTRFTTSRQFRFGCQYFCIQCSKFLANFLFTRIACKFFARKR